MDFVLTEQFVLITLSLCIKQTYKQPFFYKNSETQRMQGITEHF